MSEVKRAPVCYPLQFPAEGRLPRRPDQFYSNLSLQDAWEREYHDSLRFAAGRPVARPCCKTLHVTLCFDGTGNNLNQDVFESTPPHPSNIARMFRASIGAGHAGGTGHGASKARRLTDELGSGYANFYKYYMPGVGTPFAEVGDLDYSSYGLAFGGRGEERLNWGLLMIIDALRRTLGLARLDNSSLQATVRAMTTLPGRESNGSRNRWWEFHKQLEVLIKPLQLAMAHHQPGYPKLLGIKLYIYGFSRGAALARAFVNWLNRLLSPVDVTPCLRFGQLKLPVSVAYLGLLDTVASVGLADIVPGMNGHMAWANGTQQLPKNDLVKRCLHIVAAHEQRLCFPLESIRRPNGEYPQNSVEVIYPGVHSDIGGGYPPGDQGKAVGDDDRLLLSQIALNDLYADALSNGAPLKVPEGAIPPAHDHAASLIMDFDLVEAFRAGQTLAFRFNAWRISTLNLHPTPQPQTHTDSCPGVYCPASGIRSVETAIRDQMAWLTAWRIDRYALASLKKTPFYRQATDTQAAAAVRAAAKAERDAQQKAIEKRRLKQSAQEHLARESKLPHEPGIPDFDADMAQTQLREAAEEFRQEYRGPGLLTGIVIKVALISPVSGVLAHQLTAEARAERASMKAAGQALVLKLFPLAAHVLFYHPTSEQRDEVDESRNAEQPEGLLRALFDDHIHDSRAWFLYDRGREPGGTYLSERMVFFGDSTRRELALYRESEAGMLARISPSAAADLTMAEHAAPMTAEQTAQGLKAIEQIFADYRANLGEVNDAAV